MPRQPRDRGSRGDGPVHLLRVGGVVGHEHDDPSLGLGSPRHAGRLGQRRKERLGRVVVAAAAEAHPHGKVVHESPERGPVQGGAGDPPQGERRRGPLPLAVSERDQTDAEAGGHPAQKIAQLSDFGLERGDLRPHAAGYVKGDHQVQMGQLVGRRGRHRAGVAGGTRHRVGNRRAYRAGHGLGGGRRRLGSGDGDRCRGRRRGGNRGAGHRSRRHEEGGENGADDRFRARNCGQQRDRLRGLGPRGIGNEGKDDDRNQDECAERRGEQVKRRHAEERQLPISSSHLIPS